jgi:hypothetical protein
MQKKKFLISGLGILPVICLLPTLVCAQVTGVWNTTALTRLDVTAIKAPGLKAEHTVDIADSTYSYRIDGSFVAGDITGSWIQNKLQYTIKVNKLILENVYRQMLEAPASNGKPSDLFVNSVKLVNSKLLGTQLDNGILGTESYEYHLDLTSKNTGRREVIKVKQTVQLAGQPPKATANSASLMQLADISVKPAYTPMAASVNAIRKYMSQL